MVNETFLTRKKKKKVNLITEGEQNLNQFKGFKSPSLNADSIRIKATDEHIEGKTFNRSKNLAQPTRSNILFESTASNL
jgi:hypothetical protein